MHMNRTSIVAHVIVSSVTSASTLIIGDTAKVTSHNRAFAVQRQVAKFFADEAEFEDFPFFSKYIPQPSINGRINMKVMNESPYIRVNSVDIIGVAEASTMQVGSTRSFELESRIKHFRQFVTDEPQASASDSADKPR